MHATEAESSLNSKKFRQCSANLINFSYSEYYGKQGKMHYYYYYSGLCSTAEFMGRAVHWEH